MPDLPAAASAQAPRICDPKMINLRSQPGSQGRGERGSGPGGRERRPGATRRSIADGSRRGRPSIDAALDGWEDRRLLLDHISDAVFATDTADRITHWTASAERLFGYSAGEAVGRSFGELLPFTMARPGDELERNAALKAGRSWRGAATVRLRDGHEIWIGSAAEPIMAHGRLRGSVSVSHDITSIHEAQMSLADEERFVSSVLDVIGALVLVLDAQGRVTRFNSACERLSGYTHAEVVGRVVWDDLIPPAEVGDVRVAVAALLAGTFPNSFENHWLTRTGELRLISWQNTCLTDDQGAVTHVIATGIDITERKKAEEELHHELVLMHMLMENIPAQVYFKDRDSRFIRISSNGARALGLSDPGQAIGKTDFDFFTDEHAHQAYEDEQEVIRTGHAYTTEERETRAGLPDTWVSTSKLPLRDADERIIGTFGISVDITDRRQAEEALRERERFVEAVLGATEALVIVLDPQGRVVRLNDACERLSGYHAADILGRAFWDLLLPSADIEAMRAEFDNLQAGAFPNSHESQWTTVAGELRLISWQNTCLTDDQGAVTHVIATGIDITEARRRHEAMRGLETVGRLLADQGWVPSALDAVLGEMQARMGYRLLALYLNDGTGLRLAAQRGYRAMPERLDTSTGVVGRVHRTGRAQLVSDVTGDLDYVPWDESVGSEVAVPLIGDGETLGVLNIEAAPPGTMTESDMQFARTIADRLSISLRRSQAREALRDRTRLFTALAEFAAAVNAIREPDRLVAALIDAVGAVVPSDTVVITMLDRSDGRYRVKAVRGLAQAAVGAIIEPGNGTAGRAISERAVILTEPHPRAETNAALRDYMHYESVRTVGVPLIRDDKVLGVISVGRADTDVTFTAAEREVFALLGSHVALALTNAHLVEEVSALAIHDGLTGLYNRRHFDAALELAIARFKRRGPAANLAAIMFDLDHFGDFNRRHGHLAGDAALRLFGEILRKRLRSADIVARYGGEEFVAILDDCGLIEATRLADEVRRELEARTVPGADGHLLRATVSAGCAVIDPTDPTQESLLGLADARLFMAKEAGRNRVVAV